MLTSSFPLLEAHLAPHGLTYAQCSNIASSFAPSPQPPLKNHVAGVGTTFFFLGASATDAILGNLIAVNIVATFIGSSPIDR